MNTGWIKMRGSLINSPKLIRFARHLAENGRFNDWAICHDTDPSDPLPILTEHALRSVALSLLCVTWSASREHGKYIESNLVLEGLSLVDLDSMGGAPGIGAAMSAVGWAIECKEPQAVFLPNFKEHNVPATPAERMQASRERDKSVALSLRNGCADSATNASLHNSTLQYRTTKGDKSPLEPPKRSRKKSESYSDDFIRFWSSYPPIRRTAKRTAWTAWQAAITRADPEAIIAAAAEFSLSPSGKSKFCPGPAPWLNQNRWEDERQSWQLGDGTQPPIPHKPRVLTDEEVRATTVADLI